MEDLNQLQHLPVAIILGSINKMVQLATSSEWIFNHSTVTIIKSAFIE